MFPSNESLPHKNIVLLLTPSLLSGWCCALGSASVVGGLEALSRLRNSELLEFAVSWQSNMLHQSYLASIVQAGKSARFQSTATTLSTFLLWLIVGFILYFLLYAVFDIVYAVHEAKLEMDYVHLRRRQFIVTMLERTGVRLLALVMLIVAVGVLMRHTIPGLLSAVQSSQVTIQAYLHLLLTWGELALMLHVVVVLVRLLALRTRFIGGVE